MSLIRVVIDTNIVLVALISARGKSFQMLSMIGNGAFDICLSPPLALEYEDVLKRMIGEKLPLDESDVDDVIDFLCAHSQRLTIYFLWRPFLNDPKDDMVLEAAVSGQCQFIITFNTSDFRGVEQFGIEAISPADFLKRIGVLQ